MREANAAPCISSLHLNHPKENLITLSKTFCCITHSSTSLQTSFDAKEPIQCNDTSAHRKIILKIGDVDPFGVLSDTPNTPPGNESLWTSPANGIASLQSKKTKEWDALKSSILSDTLSMRCRIRASLLKVDESDDSLNAMHASSGAVLKRAKERLRSLERAVDEAHTSDDISSMIERSNVLLDLSQTEYIASIRAMKSKMIEAWENNRKVEALKITINCIKILGDTETAPELYPLAFVLLSEILDSFKKLVYKRIESFFAKGTEAIDIEIQARETCRNWFYKTACIRELLPRVYIEVALLPCYRFLSDGELEQILLRISSMIKGVADPLIAVYAQVYLIRSASCTMQAHHRTIVGIVHDYCFILRHFLSKRAEYWLHCRERYDAKTGQMLAWTTHAYLALHTPAVEWLLRYAAGSSDASIFSDILQNVKEICPNSLLYKHLFQIFDASNYSEEASEMYRLLRSCDETCYRKLHILSILAFQLGNSKEFGRSIMKLDFLNKSWRYITRVKDERGYLECAAAYMKLIVMHFSVSEALILLKDVVKHLKIASNQVDAEVYDHLGSFAEHVMQAAQSQRRYLSEVVPSEDFMTVLGMFKKEASIHVAKKILRAFLGNAETSHPRHPVTGPEAAIAQTLFAICCRIHDQLDMYQNKLEFEQASRDIGEFISRLGVLSSFGLESQADFDQRGERKALLQLYTDSRKAFYKLDLCKAILIRQSLALAMSADQTGKYIITAAHNRDFIKSCLAFAQATIPSLSDACYALLQLRLTTLSASVALVSNSLPQLDAALKTAIKQIAGLDSSRLFEPIFVQSDPCTHYHSEAMLSTCFFEALKELVAVLTYAPSVPPVIEEDSMFYYATALRRALLDRLLMPRTNGDKKVPKMQFRECILRIQCQILLLQLLGHWLQPELPDRIDGVDSNDILYPGESCKLKVRAQLEMAIHALSIDIKECVSQLLPVGEERFNSIAILCSLVLDCIQYTCPLLELDLKDNGNNCARSASILYRFFRIFQQQILIYRASKDERKCDAMLQEREERILMYVGNLLDQDKQSFKERMLGSNEGIETANDKSKNMEKRAIVMAMLSHMKKRRAP